LCFGNPLQRLSHPAAADAAAMDAGDPSTSFALTAAEASPQSPTKRNKKPANPPKRFVHTPIPPSILFDPILTAAATSLLPANYNFELPKTAHRIRSAGACRVALQLPEGLLPLSHLLAPYLQPDPTNDVLVLADATYGACCLADRPVKVLTADFVVHYGHSCLVPVTSSLLLVLYVFIEIRVDASLLPSATPSWTLPPRPAWPSQCGRAGTDLEAGARERGYRRLQVVAATNQTSPTPRGRTALATPGSCGPGVGA